MKRTITKSYGILPKAANGITGDIPRKNHWNYQCPYCKESFTKKGVQVHKGTKHKKELRIEKVKRNEK